MCLFVGCDLDFIYREQKEYREIYNADKKNTKQNNSNTTKKQEHVCSVKIQPQNVEEHD